MVALCAAAVGLQSGGGPWRNIKRDVRIEAHDDSIAVRDDASMLRDIAKSAPVEIKVMWNSLRYNVTALHASARAETKVAITRLSPRPRDW